MMRVRIDCTDISPVGSFLRASAQALMPSSCGMLVYSELTSRVHRSVLIGSNLVYGSIICRKCVLSLTNYVSLGTHGCRKWSTNCDILSVGESFPDMIGLPGGGV